MCTTYKPLTQIPLFMMLFMTDPLLTLSSLSSSHILFPDLYSILTVSLRLILPLPPPYAYPVMLLLWKASLYYLPLT
ncbi:hypothetical protein EV122DRAFT_264464 [Schizophyllum commune]